MKIISRRLWLRAGAGVVCTGLAISFAGLFSAPEQGCAWAAEALADAPKPPELQAALRAMDEVYRADTAVGRMEMLVVKGKKQRKLTMKTWTKGQSHSLIVIESPARDKGTATLKVEKNLWNYLPKISKTVRIPPSMMLGSWMGSDLTNDDLVKDASYRDDFNSSWAGRSTTPAGWVLKMEAKPDRVGLWKRIEMVVNDDATIPLLARYYDRKDRLARTMHFEKVQKMGGRTIPTVTRLVPEDKKDEYTVMTYLDMQFNVDVPDSTFSLSRLKRGR